MALRATPTERVAGLAFFLFTLFQVPYFVVETDLAPPGLIVLSPLQVTAAQMARTAPGLQPYIEAVLLPGAWLRDGLSAFIRCQYRSSGQGPCDAQRARLTDLAFVRSKADLPLLVRLLDGRGIEQQTAITYGCGLIAVSAAFSLVASIKTALAGFLLIGYGVTQGNHIPLPPGVLIAFLAVYAGFNLGELRGNARAAAAARPSRQQEREGAARAAAAAGGRTPAAASKSGGAARKRSKVA